MKLYRVFVFVYFSRPLFCITLFVESSFNIKRGGKGGGGEGRGREGGIKMIKGGGGGRNVLSCV